MESQVVHRKRIRPTKPHYTAMFAGRSCRHKHYTPEAALKCMFSLARDVIRFNDDVRTNLKNGTQLEVFIQKVDIHGQNLI